MGENTAIGYVRVSTEEQAREGVSLDAQTERIRAYCAMAGLELAEILREEAVSAFSVPLHRRPLGRQVAALDRRSPVRHVVALKLDRLFRDAVDALEQVRQWDQGGVALHLIDQGGSAFNTASATGRFFISMMASFAELERNLIAERTALALAHKRSRREVYSPVPVGFVRKGNRLVEEPGEMATVRRILAEKGAGKSLNAIARDLNRQRVATKTGGMTRWYAATVKQIVANGERLYRSA